MEKEFLLGLMAGNTRECTTMMKSKAMAFLNGQMEGYTKETGPMENNMEMLPTPVVKALNVKGSGKMGRGLDGKKAINPKID